MQRHQTSSGHIEIQLADEIISTIIDAVVLQRFAHEFAVASGFDPDAPKGLSKVTLTN